MMGNDFYFNNEQFSKLFPFYILLSEKHSIISIGKSLSKVMPVESGKSFFKYFSIKRPTIFNWKNIRFQDMVDQVIILESNEDRQFVLRGQFEIINTDRSEFLFVGTPWFGSMDEVVGKKLTIHDFATHDAMIDLLHVLKTQEITTDEVKQLLTKVNLQKDILKLDQAELKKKENLLQSVANATDELLSNTDFYNAVSKSLIILGKALGIHRINFFQNIIESDHSIQRTSRKFSWDADTDEVNFNDYRLTDLPLSVFDECLCKLVNKEAYSTLVRHLPQGSLIKRMLLENSIKALVVVPIFFRDVFWGFVGYDDCWTERVWSDAEIALLKSFSNSISNALDRSEHSKALYNMALFAMENPDPVFRINMNGEVLLRNTQANQLQFFLVGGSRISDQEFFRYLVDSINVHNPVQSYEAVRDSRTYLVVASISENLEHINIYSSDITEKKKAEDLLKESENRVSSLILNLQTGILLEDENRHIVLVNKMFCDIFGIPVPPDELTGVDCSNAAEQSKHLFKDADIFANEIETILKNRVNVLSQNIEMADGRILERDYIPIFVYGHYKGHLWKYTDVTERKHYERNLKLQEEKYKSIIENMNLGLIEVNPQDEIQYANQTFCDISGYSQEELISQSASGLFTTSEIGNLIREKNELRKQGVSDSYQICIQNKKGEQRWWLVSGAPNYNREGDFVGTIGIHLDITDQKVLEEELRISKQKAEESSEAKAIFLANMSHEIRTPLNAIIGMVRELKKSELNYNQSVYLKHASSASQHLLSIVNNILDISKIAAGEFNLENRAFSLLSVFREAEAIMLPAAKEKMLALEFNITDDLAPAFSGDAGRIRQILINIISNAIKFTHLGGVKVKCQSLRRNENEQCITIVISDTGIGMDRSYLKNLFKKFSQEDVTTARKYGGTGLGMAITYELLQMMDGRIEVVSEKNKGTMFHILLKFKIDNNHDEDQAMLTESFSFLKNKRLLLVEDNELNRLVATHTLNHYEVKITEAVNGLEALDLLKSNSFDLILMDLQMPVMDGLEATRILRQELKIQTPVLALTANAFKNEIDKCITAGMNDHVTKPFEEKVLVDTILRNIKKGNHNHTVTIPFITKPDDKIDDLYNLDTIHSISRGDNKFVAKMVEMFCVDMSEAVALIRDSFQKNDFCAVQKIAHRIKPGILTFNINSLRNDIKFLESEFIKDNSIEASGEVIDRVDKIIMAVIAALGNIKL